VPKTKVLEQYPHPKYPRLIIDRRTNSRFYQARTFLDGKLKQKSTKSDHLPTAFKLGEDWYKREAILDHDALGRPLKIDVRRRR
jgi:hypothetical protein